MVHDWDDTAPLTSSVPMHEYAERIRTPLQPGHELRCPHCRQWHVVITQHQHATGPEVIILAVES